MGYGCFTIISQPCFGLNKGFLFSKAANKRWHPVALGITGCAAGFKNAFMV